MIQHPISYQVFKSVKKELVQEQEKNNGRSPFFTFVKIGGVLISLFLIGTMLVETVIV